MFNKILYLFAISLSVTLAGCSTVNRQVPINPGDCMDPNNGLDCFPVPPSSCGEVPPGRELPFNIVRGGEQNPPNGFPKRNYVEAFGPDPWPSDTPVVGLWIPRGRYLALPFVADPASAIWRMTWVASPTSGLLVQSSISRCPGEFETEQQNCQVSTSPNGTIVAVVESNPLGCNLEPGQVYYWNVRHTKPDGEDACHRDQCELLARGKKL